MRSLAIVGVLYTVFSAASALYALGDAPTEIVKRENHSFKPHTHPSFCSPSKGYVMCGSDVCYLPSKGQVCCDPNQNWGCPANTFCLVNGHCCPDGKDPQSCADQFGVSISSNFNTAPYTPSYTTYTPTYTSYTNVTYKPTGSMGPTTTYKGPPPTAAAKRVEGGAFFAGIIGAVAGLIAL